MTFIVLGCITLATLMTLGSGLAAMCQKITLGSPRTSALVALGCSSLCLTSWSVAISGMFNGVHLVGTLTSYISFSVVLMRLNNARYDHLDERA